MPNPMTPLTLEESDAPCSSDEGMIVAAVANPSQLVWDFLPVHFLATSTFRSLTLKENAHLELCNNDPPEIIEDAHCDFVHMHRATGELRAALRACQHASWPKIAEGQHKDFAAPFHTATSPYWKSGRSNPAAHRRILLKSVPRMV